MSHSKPCLECREPALDGKTRCEPHMLRRRAYSLKWYFANKAKATESRRAWQRSNPDHLWAYSLRVKYGLTPEDFEAMLKNQRGKCAIPECGAETPGGRSKRWHVDHDHVTGVVRGLLCNSCNVGLGFFDDRPELLRAAAAYLERKAEEAPAVSGSGAN